MLQKLKKYFKCIITKVNLFKSQLITGSVLIIDRAPVLIVDPDPASIIKKTNLCSYNGCFKVFLMT